MSNSSMGDSPHEIAASEGRHQSGQRAVSLRPRDVWMVTVGMLRLLLGRGPVPSEPAAGTGTSGWGMTTTQAPSGYTEEGALAHNWAFIDGALSRRTKRHLVALWTLRLFAVAVIAGSAVLAISSWL
jgi:hypothetical protein